MSKKKVGSYNAACCNIGMGSFTRGRAIIDILGYGVLAATIGKARKGQILKQCEDPDLAEGAGSRKRCAALFKLASLCLLEIQLEAKHGK